MNRFFLAVVSAAFLTVSCGGDSGGSSGTTTGGDLTHDQATALNRALSDVFLTASTDSPMWAFTEGGRLAAPRSQVGGDYDWTLNISNVCEEGGTYSLSGSGEGSLAVGMSGGNNTITMGSDETFDVDFTDCGFMDEDGNSYVIDGTLSTVGATDALLSQATDATDTEPFNIDMSTSNTIEGTLAITGDLEVATCDVDFTMSQELVGETPILTLTVDWDGSICGSTTSGSMSFDINVDEE